MIRSSSTSLLIIFSSFPSPPPSRILSSADPSRRVLVPPKPKRRMLSDSWHSSSRNLELELGELALHHAPKWNRLPTHQQNLHYHSHSRIGFSLQMDPTPARDFFPGKHLVIATFIILYFCSLWSHCLARGGISARRRWSSFFSRHQEIPSHDGKSLFVFGWLPGKYPR